MPQVSEQIQQIQQKELKAQRQQIEEMKRHESENEWPEDDDDGWGDEDNDDGWDMGSDNEGSRAVSEIVMEKAKSYGQTQIKVLTMKDIMMSHLPKKINEATELLCLDSQDDVIAVIRYFKWNMP